MCRLFCLRHVHATRKKRLTLAHALYCESRHRQRGGLNGVLSRIAKFTAPNVAGKLVCAGTAPAARLRVQPVVPRPRIVGRVAAGAHLRARRARSHVLVVGLRFLRTEPHEVISRRLHGMSNRLKKSVS